MSILSQKQSEPTNFFLMNDQPFICPYFGTRCNEIANLYHTNAKAIVEQCLNTQCGFVCYELEDEYFLRLWMIN